MQMEAVSSASHRSATSIDQYTSNSISSSSSELGLASSSDEIHKYENGKSHMKKLNGNLTTTTFASTDSIETKHKRSPVEKLVSLFKRRKRGSKSIIEQMGDDDGDIKDEEFSKSIQDFRSNGSNANVFDNEDERLRYTKREIEVKESRGKIKPTKKSLSVNAISTLGIGVEPKEQNFFGIGHCPKELFEIKRSTSTSTGSQNWSSTSTSGISSSSVNSTDDLIISGLIKLDDEIKNLSSSREFPESVPIPSSEAKTTSDGNKQVGQSEPRLFEIEMDLDEIEQSNFEKHSRKSCPHLYINQEMETSIKSYRPQNRMPASLFKVSKFDGHNKSDAKPNVKVSNLRDNRVKLVKPKYFNSTNFIPNYKSEAQVEVQPTNIEIDIKSDELQGLGSNLLNSPVSKHEKYKAVNINAAKISEEVVAIDFQRFQRKIVAFPDKNPHSLSPTFSSSIRNSEFGDSEQDTLSPNFSNTNVWSIQRDQNSNYSTKLKPLQSDSVQNKFKINIPIPQESSNFVFDRRPRRQTSLNLEVCSTGRISPCQTNYKQNSSSWTPTSAFVEGFRLEERSNRRRAAKSSPTLDKPYVVVEKELKPEAKVKPKDPSLLKSIILREKNGENAVESSDKLRIPYYVIHSATETELIKKLTSSSLTKFKSFQVDRDTEYSLCTDDDGDSQSLINQLVVGSLKFPSEISESKETRRKLMKYVDMEHIEIIDENLSRLIRPSEESISESVKQLKSLSSVLPRLTSPSLIRNRITPGANTMSVNSVNLSSENLEVIQKLQMVGSTFETSFLDCTDDNQISEINMESSDEGRQTIEVEVDIHNNTANYNNGSDENESPAIIPDLECEEKSMSLSNGIPSIEEMANVESTTHLHNVNPVTVITNVKSAITEESTETKLSNIPIPTPTPITPMSGANKVDFFDNNGGLDSRISLSPMHTLEESELVISTESHESDIAVSQDYDTSRRRQSSESFTDSFKHLQPFNFNLNAIHEGKRERLYKVLVVGELGTGKTSIIKRYVHQFFSQHYRATIGVDFALKVLRWDQDTVVRLQLWDIAGQERFGSMTRVYYKEAVGAFVVFDVTRTATLDAVAKWKTDLDSKVVLPDGRPIPTVLLANKSDQPKEGLAAHREKMNEFCKQQGFAAWFETSAKENIHIEESANFLVSRILEMDRWSREPMASDPDKVELGMNGKHKPLGGSGGCSC